MTNTTIKGIQFHKGDIVRIEGFGPIANGIYEVEEDVSFWEDFNSWGSVKLRNQYPPLHTHKGGIKLVVKNSERKDKS